MKDKDDLIYSLIFSKENKFNIEVADYIKKIYNYRDFMDEIKAILFKSKVMILKDVVDIIDSDVDTEMRIIWKLKVKK